MKRKTFLFSVYLFLMSQNLFSQSWYVQFKNNFTVDDDEIGVGIGYPASPEESPYYDDVHNGQIVNLAAYDNQWVDNNDFKISFNDSEAPLKKSRWFISNPGGGGVGLQMFEQSPSFTANSSVFTVPNPIVQADMRRWVRIKFSNQFNGSSMGGQMIVNSQTYSAPTNNFEVIEENYISFSALQSYTDNGINYSFQNWSDNVTDRNRSEKLWFFDDEDELTAVYKGYAIFNENPAQGNLRNLTITPSVPHGYVKLTWDEHPNTDVTKYKIYRRYKYDGSYSPITLIATKLRGSSTHTYTDVEFEIDQQNGEYQVEYDVKAYFAPDNTESSHNFMTVFGDRSGQLSKLGGGEEITYYDIANYPNPYNPQTTIRFQLPQEGFVTIKVYNSLGQEIKTLLNEKKDYGRYELKFDGSDLPSGMYIYTIKVNDYYASKKMLLLK